MARAEAMGEPAPARPAAVTVLGWSFIVLAALMLASGLGALPVAALVRRTWDELGPSLPPGFGRIASLLRYFVPLALLQLGAAVVAMVGGVLVLRLRETGRLMLEALNWFGLLFTIAVSAWLIPMWSRIMAEIARQAPEQAGAGAVVVGPAPLVATSMVQVATIVVIIWVLRSKTVRNAMQP